jgi:proline iminopeptidase
MMTTFPLLTIHLATCTPLGDGRVAEWEAVGDGEPLVWVEGGPGLPAHLARADVVPFLDRFRCHLVNAPGCGRSTPPADESGYDLESIVEFFETWRQAIGLGPVTLMGHSWGGLVAPAWAALHPESIRRVIVLDGYAGGGSVDPAEAKAESTGATDRFRDRPWYADAIAAWAVDTSDLVTEEDEAANWSRGLPFYFAEPDDPVSRQHIERLAREQRCDMAAMRAWSGDREEADYRPLLSTVRCPTLVVVGEHDFICGPVWNRALAAAIPNARLVVMPGVGHIPPYEAPDRLRAIVDEWLAGQTP